MTETIKVQVDERLARRFRRRAMERYGYKKGSVKKALERLMEDFAGQDSEKRAHWESLRGVLKNEYKSMTSTQLQHSIWRIKYDYHNNRYKRVH